jgi:hypothetical protein
MNAGEYEEAGERLDRALAAAGSAGGIPRVRVEAERLRFVVACATGDRAGAPGFFARYAADAARAEVGEGRREAARELLERCTMTSEVGAGR